MSANDEFTILKDPAQFAVERLVDAGSDAGRDPDAVAIVDGDKTRTYAQLDDAASRVANGLVGLGLEHDDRVAFVGRNCVESAELMLGAARAGVVLTIVNWRLQPGELSFVLLDSAAVVVVTTTEFAETLRALPEIAGVKQFLVVDSPTAADDWAAWIGRQPLDAVTVERTPVDVVVQLYTSGTTGRPKGAMLTRSSLAACIPDTAALWELDPTSVVLSVLPMFHIAGAGTLLGALWAGCRLIIDNDASTTGILRAVERHRVTNLVLASVMLQGLVRAPECATADLSSVRTVSYGAAPISSDVLNAARAKLPCRIMQPYGLTETTGVLTVLDAQDHAFDPNGPDAPAAVARLRSCGRPRAGVEIRVVDIQTGSPLAAGEAGEVQARSARLMAGYWNQPEATAEALLPDGWFRTGDVGQVDEDGSLFLLDRLKDTIISGGENIYPAEVEDVLHSHPDVAEVAIIGVPDERWGETPLAVVVRNPGSDVSEADLIAFARTHLAGYKCPSRVEFADALPRNPTGKVLRRALREPHWAGHERRIN